MTLVPVYKTFLCRARIYCMYEDHDWFFNSLLCWSQYIFSAFSKREGAPAGAIIDSEPGIKYTCLIDWLCLIYLTKFAAAIDEYIISFLTFIFNHSN